mmetsp:Transcript_62118/g.102539  ORF Transcript_62118/g.102539 Transcript_62118/m.102539 type:complete len:261 (+) Transcript_62118:3047-3829(+)
MIAAGCVGPGFLFFRQLHRDRGRHRKLQGEHHGVVLRSLIEDGFIDCRHNLHPLGTGYFVHDLVEFLAWWQQTADFFRQMAKSPGKNSPGLFLRGQLDPSNVWLTGIHFEWLVREHQALEEVTVDLRFRFLHRHGDFCAFGLLGKQNAVHLRHQVLRTADLHERWMFVARQMHKQPLLLDELAACELGHALHAWFAHHLMEHMFRNLGFIRIHVEQERLQLLALSLLHLLTQIYIGVGFELPTAPQLRVNNLHVRHCLRC